MDSIRIEGARTHNLKNITLELPRNQLIVITGLSGSGKSSLAFDTLYAEGQRRYVESLSAYARQFLSIMEKPDVDHIAGLSPAISIEQKSTSHNPRSTVGTVTEIYDYLRLLFARTGEPRCPEHQQPLRAQTVSEMVDEILALPDGSRVALLAPVVKERKGEHAQLLEQLRARGFVRARMNGELCELDDPPKLALRKKHTIEVVVDRFKIRPDIQTRLADSLETALELADGVVLLAPLDHSADHAIEERLFSARYACPHCHYSLTELEPRLFSFNNPAGACPTCDGLGHEQFFDPAKIVVNPDLSLAAGAIRGWDRRNGYYYQLLKSLANHYQFDMESPFNELPDAVQQAVLFGSGKEKLELVYQSARLGEQRKIAPFEGVIPNIRRRYRDTDSLAVREELAKFLSHRLCPDCGGSRLHQGARNVFVGQHTLPQMSEMAVSDALVAMERLHLDGWRGEIATKIVKEIGARLQFLVNVGLDYLTLSRSADTLSGGESQRIRLASQIGAGLVGVMYVLDEPSIGLHQRDNERLLQTLFHLRDIGNSVIVVEHDEEAIRSADYVVDIGPGAGVHGGEVVACGTLTEIMASDHSLTADYLCGRRAIACLLSAQRRLRATWCLKGQRATI